MIHNHTHSKEIKFTDTPTGVCGNEVQLVLYCPCSDQGPPMFLTWLRPLSWNTNYLCPLQSQSPAQLRKTEVIADNNPDSSNRTINNAPLFTSLEVAVLPQQGKQVNLTVRGNDLATINDVSGVIHTPILGIDRLTPYNNQLILTR